MEQGFKRINFFKGLFTRAEDWRATESYHNDKRRLHNKFLHTPGIVPDCLNELRVIAMEGGTSLRIEPGYAIDGEGRDLYLPLAVDVPLTLRDYNPPRKIYAVIRYAEQETDWR